jgi:hypothetical protein
MNETNMTIYGIIKLSTVDALYNEKRLMPRIAWA